MEQVSKRDEFKVSRNVITFSIAIGFLFDAYVSSIFGVTLKPISQQMHQSLAIMGDVGSLFLAGYTVGTLFFGLLADRIGRKLALTMSIAGYGIITVVTGFSHDIFQYAVGRFLTGVAGGGELTVGITFLVEIWYAGRRTFATGMMIGGYGAGLIFTAFMARVFVPLYGWRSLYFLAIVPATLIFLIRFKIAESPRFIAVQTALKNQSKNMKRGLYICLRDVDFRRNMTIGIAIYAGISYITYTQFFYSVFVIESFYHESISRAVDIYLLFAVSYFVSAFGWGYIGDIIGRKIGGISVIILLMFSTILMYFGNSILWLIVFGCLSYCCIAGVWVISTAHVAELFPTEVRGTAYGWVVAIGRIPSIFAPLVVGYTARILPGGLKFALQISTASLIFALGAYVLGRETIREEIIDLIGQQLTINSDP